MALLATERPIADAVVAAAAVAVADDAEKTAAVGSSCVEVEHEAAGVAG